MARLTDGIRPPKGTFLPKGDKTDPCSPAVRVTGNRFDVAWRADGSGVIGLALR